MHMQIIKDKHITCDVEINNSTKANQVYYQINQTTEGKTEINNNTNTDIQPKISIDEISLLWLFCGC